MEETLTVREYTDRLLLGYTLHMITHNPKAQLASARERAHTATGTATHWHTSTLTLIVHTPSTCN